MHHFPGTWKYAKPDYDFDYWAIAQMEKAKANYEPLLNMTNEQFDQVGNTELLPWMVLFGANGNQPAELITYQPTWHHGHAQACKLPAGQTHRQDVEGRCAGPATYTFKDAGGYEFYKHPSPSAFKPAMGPLRPALQARTCACAS